MAFLFLIQIHLYLQSLCFLQENEQLMGNIFNDDFRDFLQALNNHKMDYILVGGSAVITNDNNSPNTKFYNELLHINR